MTSPTPELGRRLLTASRVLVALMIFGAVVTEIATLVERDRFEPGNLFSYFTIQSNLFAAAVLLVGAVTPEHGRRLTLFRGAATLYMAITGIVFSVLLAGIDGAEFTAVPWDNTALHFLGPIAVVADWFIDRPSLRIPFRSALIWLAYPLAYGAYSLIRGAFVDWYPYPFIDPDEHGYPTIVVTVLALTAFGAVLTWIIATFSGERRTRTQSA